MTIPNMKRDFDTARIAWDDREYPVIPHCDWSIKSRSKVLRAQTLKFHPGYWDAKRHSDYTSAQEIMDDLISDSAIDKISQLIPNRHTQIIAPQMKHNDNRNVIPTWFAHNIGHQLGLKINNTILQEDRAHRTGRNAFYRLANEPSFTGKVDKDQPYLIVDDVATLGGTLAALRNYIEKNGGYVAGISVLADANPGRARAREIGPKSYDLRVDEKTLSTLFAKHGRTLDKFWERNMGSNLDSLTGQEAAFLSFIDSTHDLMKNIIGARVRDEQHDSKSNQQLTQPIKPHPG